MRVYLATSKKEKLRYTLIESIRYELKLVPENTGGKVSFGYDSLGIASRVTKTSLLTRGLTHTEDRSHKQDQTSKLGLVLCKIAQDSFSTRKSIHLDLIMVNSDHN